MYDVIKTLPIGAFSTNSSYAGLVGVPLTDYDGKVYRLVQSTAVAITNPARKVLFSAIATGGGYSNVVAIPTSAKQKAIAGVIPSAYGTTTITASAYFWVQVEGPSSVLAYNSLITNGRLLYAASVLGKTRGWTTAPAFSIGGVTFAVALNTVAVTAKATNSTSPTIAVWITGIL